MSPSKKHNEAASSILECLPSQDTGARTTGSTAFTSVIFSSGEDDDSSSLADHSASEVEDADTEAETEAVLKKTCNDDDGDKDAGTVLDIGAVATKSDVLSDAIASSRVLDFEEIGGNSTLSPFVCVFAEAPTAAGTTGSRSTNSRRRNNRDRSLKGQAIARRDKRRRLARLGEEAQQRREKEEAIAREAAARQGFQGNMICSASRAATATGSAVSSAAATGTLEAAAEGFFWEIDYFLDRRETRGGASGRKQVVEMLTKWKNCDESEATWEPLDNLCDTAYDDAIAWWSKEKMKRERLEENERKLGLLPPIGKQDDGSVDVTMVDADPESTTSSAQASGGDASNESAVGVENRPDIDGIEISQGEEQVNRDEASIPTNTASADPKVERSDSSQVKFRPIRRVSVHDADAKDIVAEARTNGIPIVLTGHKGWTNFARRWLRKREDGAKESSVIEGKATEQDGVTEAANMVTEFSSPDDIESVIDVADTSWYLDVRAMCADIGNEEVPIVRKNYNEENPISANISAARFFESSWPQAKEAPTRAASNGSVEVADVAAHSESVLTNSSKTGSPQSSLYLHQWQFPLSESAAPKLCNQCVPLPNDIFGEDLLKYWMDEIRDCPLQYLFMGREETMSKMHKDSGGLEISIAPIVGIKECCLVHRDDGQQCLYHLQAPLDDEDIDLDAYPLLAVARIWKTTIKPGEILLMPQGTYHQCRNVTPCLSYSRFHLDTLNLRYFLTSMFDGDAPEIHHDDVIWNSVQELMTIVDKATDVAKKVSRDKIDVVTEVDPVVSRAVETLRSLRHIVREITRKLDVRQQVKGLGGLPDSRRGSLEDRSKIDGGPKLWQCLVDDIDLCLHEFCYRFSRDGGPDFAHRRSLGKKRLAMPTVIMPGTRDSAKKGKGKSTVGKRGKTREVDQASIERPVVAYDSEMERVYLTLPMAPPCEERSAVDKHNFLARIVPGSRISVRIQGRKCRARVSQLVDSMRAAYMSYEDYPSIYDEYQPCDLLREPSPGGSLSEIDPENIRPGHVCVSLVGEKRDEYRGSIHHTKCDTFLQVKMIFGKVQLERWIDLDSVISVEEPMCGNKKRNNSSSGMEFLSSEELWDQRAARQQGMHVGGTVEDEPKDDV